MNKLIRISAALAVLPALLIAQEQRELGSHEHGSGVLNIARDGKRIAMQFEAPGADIVGFEFAATQAADRAATDTAISDLARPLDLFVVPEEAGCTVTAANVQIIGGDEHDGDNHEEPGPTHTEFIAEYMLECAAPDAITRIDFAYFERFPNAEELDVQVVSDNGARAFEVERADPVLDMRGMF